MPGCGIPEQVKAQIHCERVFSHSDSRVTSMLQAKALKGPNAKSRFKIQEQERILREQTKTTLGGTTKHLHTFGEDPENGRFNSIESAKRFDQQQRKKAKYA